MIAFPIQELWIALANPLDHLDALIKRDERLHGFIMELVGQA